MKKYHLILATIATLALIVTSCNVQIQSGQPQGPQQPMPGPQNGNPENPGPQGPEDMNPGNPGPQGPGPQNGNPGNPVPQGPGPNPNGGNPGEGQILSFTADRMALNPGQCAMLQWETQGGFETRLNGQPVERSGQQQVCPPQTTVYELGLDIGNQIVTREITITVAGGNPAPSPISPTKPPKKSSPSATVTPSSPGNIINVTAIAVIANLDLAISNIYPSSTGHIMVTVKNAGNVNVSGSYKISCSGYYIDSGGNNALKLAGQYATVNLAPGKSADFDTSYSRSPSIQSMFVACTLTPPQGDTNSSNDKMGPTQVK